MKHLQLFENWTTKSSTEKIICPYSETPQHRWVWEICPKNEDYWKCEKCEKEFNIKKICSYNTFRID